MDYGTVSVCIRQSAGISPPRRSKDLLRRRSKKKGRPTDDLLEDARDVLTYLAQTAELGVTYSNAGPDAAVLTAYSDSDWSTGHSTTGWVIRLAGRSLVLHRCGQSDSG